MTENSSDIYSEIKNILLSSRSQAYSAVNFAMVQAYTLFPNPNALRSQLCSQKNEVIVKYSVLSEAKQVFASKYQLTLPTAEELQREIEKERRKIEEQED